MTRRKMKGMEDHEVMEYLEGIISRGRHTWTHAAIAAELNRAQVWRRRQRTTWTAISVLFWSRRYAMRLRPAAPGPGPRPLIATGLPRRASIQRELEPWEADRPLNRRDCRDGPRPCPWVACVYHLGIHVDANGKIRAQPGVRHGDLEALPYGGCALDCADAGAHGIRAVASALGTWRSEVATLSEQGAVAIRRVVEG